jgi:hypothetical protein
LDWKANSKSIHASAPGFELPEIYDAAIPAMQSISEVAEIGLAIALAVSILGALYTKWLRSFLRLWLAVFLLAALGSVANYDPSESLGQMAIVPVTLLFVITPIAYVFVRRIGRNNIAMYFAIVVIGELLSMATEMLSGPTTYFRLNAAILYALVAGLFALGIWLRTHTHDDASTSSLQQGID